MPISMPNISLANIVGNLLFSAAGYVAFMYGKRMGSPRQMIQGGVLMGYSYFVPDTAWLYGAGLALSAWVWFTRDA